MPEVAWAARWLGGVSERTALPHQQAEQPLPGNAQAVVVKEAATAAGLLHIPDLKLAASQFWGLFKTFSFWPKVFQLGSYDAQQQQIIDSNVAMFLALYQVKR